VSHVGVIAVIFALGLMACVGFIRKFRMKPPTTSTLEFVINEALGLVIMTLIYFALTILFNHWS
jgi:preprotein translocase subunit SecY